MTPRASRDDLTPRRSLAWAPGLTLLLLGAASAQETPTPKASEAAAEWAKIGPPPSVAARLTVSHEDLPSILESRSLRVLVPYARPFFFIENGEERGITQELFREYGSFVEKGAKMRQGDLKVVLIPCELDAVIPWLQHGYGDVVAAALTVTPGRQREVAFADPLVTGIREILVTSANAPQVSSLQDLAGREVWVAASSSYGEHLRAVNASFAELGLAPIDIVEARTTLSTEDLFEMLNAGILDLVVCDDYKADLWGEVLPGLRPRPDIVVHEGGAIAFAVRPENPQLRESLNAFVATSKRGTLLGNVLIKRYFESTRWVKNPNDAESRARIDRYAAWIREFSAEYGFDWLRVAAQCFQESKLDPNAKSRSGALGLMQLLPSTAKDMGCADPYDPEQNLRAGIKYLDWLRTHFFSQPELTEIERTDFILAAYNAGPGNVRKWRREAPSRGIDPNRWRGHVERIALESVGIQPIRYVDNIEKYYVAYTLAYDLTKTREQTLDQALKKR